MKEDIKKAIITVTIIGFVLIFLLPESVDITQYFPYILGIFVIGYFVMKMIQSAPDDKFQKKMDELGYTKRKVVYDFFDPDTQQGMRNLSLKYHWTVGIWLNYREKKLIIRKERDNWVATVINFSKIQSVEMIEDGYTVTSGLAVGYGLLAVGSATSTSYAKGLQVRLVVGDIHSGAKTHFITLYDPEFGQKINKTDKRYKAIQECARSIADEIIYIINNS
jgi:hypothetical protein